jgi:hypothetical protein
MRIICLSLLLQRLVFVLRDHFVHVVLLRWFASTGCNGTGHLAYARAMKKEAAGTVSCRVDGEWLVDSSSKQLLPAKELPAKETWLCPQHLIASIHRFTLRGDPTFAPYVMAHEVAVAMDLEQWQFLAQVRSIT